MDIDALWQRTVDAMRDAHGDESLIRLAITAYLQDGLPIESPEALTDYFCVDTPSILDDAGFDEAEGTQVTIIFDQIATSAVREFRHNSNK
jgi:hypothetical protein